MAQAHDPYGALRYRDYRFLLTSSVLSTIGAEIQAAAVGWELYKRTGRNDMLGYAGLAQFLPVLLLALPAGQVADRFSRKLILQVAQTTMALSSAALAVLSLLQGPVWLIFAWLVLVGCARAFSMSSRGALMSQVVPPGQLGSAVTWNSSGFQVANVAGPALAGIVIALLEQVAPAYVLASCCSLACVCILLPIRPRPVTRMSSGRSLAALLDGVRFVWRTELLLAAITLDLFAVLLGGATALLPVYATDILGVGPTGYGWLRGAPAMGALVMAMILAHRPPLRRAGRALIWAVMGYGAATVGFGLSRDPLLSFLLLALLGALDNISVVIRGTLMQLLTPDEMRGRVAAVNSVFISSSNELGAYESGMTAHWFGGDNRAAGAIASVIVGGIGTGIVVMIVVYLWPALYRLGPLQPPSEPPPSGSDSATTP